MNLVSINRAVVFLQDFSLQWSEPNAQGLYHVIKIARKHRVSV